jgi:NAD(P)-dependent dehydrogenase (short-subunit alcohol dehydrogenase family)
MMNEMTKVAIVSGASRGLGQAIVETLAAESYIVYALGSSEQIYATVEALGRTNVHAVRCDVRDEEQVNASIQAIIEREQTLDVLINNAGVGAFAALEDYTTAQFRAMFDVNVFGLFLLTKAVLPHMKRQRDGVVLNIASDVSRRTFSGGSLYVASKYAVQGLTGCLAQEARPYGIRVGTINPGMIDTHFAGSTQGAPGKEQFLQVAELAQLVAYVLRAPKSVNFDEIVVHPIIQEYILS